MEKFDLEKHWDGFINNKIVVNCPTEELIKEFFEYLKEKGIIWSSGHFLIPTNTNWELYKEKTCYDCRNTKLYYCNIDYFTKHDYQIVEFSGFSNKNNIKLKQNPARVENYNLMFISHPNSTTYTVKSNDEIIDIQTISNDRYSYKVFVYGKTIKVILEDGSRGIAKCSPEDDFDINIGIEIAMARAKEKFLRKRIKKLVNKKN